MITDKEILDYFISKERNSIISARINRKNLSKNKPEYMDYLKNRFDDFRDDFCESVYRIKNNIEKIPRCKKCGSLLKYHGFKENSYGKWCSSKCQLSDRDFILEREAKNTPEKKSKMSEKVKETKLKKYGDENYNNREKFFKTCIEKYDSKTPLSGKKRKMWENDLLQKYGKRALTNHKKTEETKELLYGDKNFSNRKKAKKTMMERYGAETSLEASSIAAKIKKTLKKRYGDENFRNHKKCVTTMLEKYGVENAFQMHNVRKKIDYEKILETKRKNKTFNTSKCEDSLADFLNKNYKQYTIFRSYEDDRYKNIETGNKFQCDFYIKELDLFIELNGHYTHGKHPFDKNNREDLKMLEIYKSKINPSYKALIEVWTHRDVLKIEEAKRNNLNYITIYGSKIDFNKLKTEINKYKAKEND